MKPIAVISTDWHIEEKNIEQVLDLIDQKIALAQSLKVKDLVCLGDVFESRKAQSEIVLSCFSEILDRIGNAEMTIHVIPGNHDKTDYNSESSFLTPYDYHPALKLYKKPYFVERLQLLFMPFISEDIWIDSLKSYLEQNFKKGQLQSISLCSHVAVNGSINNDKTQVESRINAGLLKPFKNVFLGHYHNAQQPLPNVFHLPSLKQKNFGEDAEKGFTVLYEDHSTKFVKSRFKEFVTISLDASETDSEILKRISDENTSDVNLRVELSGSNEQIKSLDLNKLKSQGIKIKTKSVEIEQAIVSAEQKQTISFEDNSEILKAFEEFCELKCINKEEGLYYLNKLLKND